LSDVYAMGGKPLTAMNMVAFPIKNLDRAILAEILKGGYSKVQESGALLVGGHSIEDSDTKYGLSVTGVVHPNKILTNARARPGDRLVLTKPLGTGIIATALKGGMASQEAMTKITESMATLNRVASEVMVEVGVNACTDITGFGFLGHASEMAIASDVGIVIQSQSVPIFPQAEEYASMGMVPGGTGRNRDFAACKVEISGHVPDIKMDILYDAQTSGGLLISVKGERVEMLLEQLHSKGVQWATVIGEVLEGPKGRVVLQ
ncbi:MAG: selenide, water dikinase SelD, partial [Deltaproteobacteria bacterium]|nr:selenide, water dikinase SelD [Deltaproteobacteria bacterium]